MESGASGTGASRGGTVVTHGQRSKGQRAWGLWVRGWGAGTGTRSCGRGTRLPRPPGTSRVPPAARSGGSGEGATEPAPFASPAGSQQLPRMRGDCRGQAGLRKVAERRVRLRRALSPTMRGSHVCRPVAQTCRKSPAPVPSPAPPESPATNPELDAHSPTPNPEPCPTALLPT